jgi:hypothetical protein
VPVVAPEEKPMAVDSAAVESENQLIAPYRVTEDSEEEAKPA